MKKLLILLFILIAASLVFAADVPLVSYYNSSVESHACKTGHGLCGYTNIAMIDSTGAAACGTAGSVRVLGLSDPTNAHAETNAYAFYRDNNICMNSAYFTANCYYTAKGAACTAGDSCKFGLSDFTNAHLSSCNIFGAEEVKFCCKAPLVPPACPATTNFSTNKSYYTVGEKIIFSYQCIGGSPASVDMNILIGPDNLNFFRKDSNQCSPVVTTFDINSSTLNMGGLSSKDFTAIITRNSTPACPSSVITFNIAAGGSGPVTPPGPGGDCNISKFEAGKIYYDTNVLLKYACKYNNLDANIIIFDPMGNVLKEVNGLNCGTIEKDFNNFKIPSSISGNPFFARLSVGKCMKDTFFPVTKAPGENQTIPDNNIFVLLVLLAGIIFIVTKNKGNKRLKK